MNLSDLRVAVPRDYRGNEDRFAYRSVTTADLEQLGRQVLYCKRHDRLAHELWACDKSDGFCSADRRVLIKLPTDIEGE